MSDEDPVDFKAGIEEECKTSHCASYQTLMAKCAAEVSPLDRNPKSSVFLERGDPGSHASNGRSLIEPPLARRTAVSHLDCTSPATTHRLHCWGRTGGGRPSRRLWPRVLRFLQVRRQMRKLPRPLSLCSSPLWIRSAATSAVGHRIVPCCLMPRHWEPPCTLIVASGFIPQTAPKIFSKLK